jgi:DNA-binding transcriptional MerR regulator
MDTEKLLSEKLLSIGQFANATQLSAKALRLYADNAILPPALIDAATGYRYYQPGQVRTARVVRTLRDMDMPLAQIARCIQVPEQIAAVSKAHMDAQARTFRMQQAAYQTLLAALPSPAAATAPSVRQINLPATHMQIFTFVASAQDFEMRARRIITSASAGGGTFSALPAVLPLLAPLDNADDCTLELWLPRAQSAAAEGNDLRQQAALALAGVTIGPHANGEPNLVAASDALFDWFDRNGYTLHGQPLILIGETSIELAWPLP